MKTLMILPFMLITLISNWRATPMKPFEYLSLSPLYLDAESKLVVRTTKTKINVAVTLNNDLYTNKKIYNAYLNGAGVYTLKYNNAFTRQNNTIQIKVTAGTNVYTSEEISMNLTRAKSELITENKPYYSDSLVTTFLPDSSVTTTNLMCSFENFEGLYSPDYYHKIKLSDFKINIDSKLQPLFDCNPSLIIKNADGVFNDISTSNNVEFPLTLVKLASGFTFQLKNDLYVNKETLLLSSVPKDGYVKTKHIFLPRNNMQNESKFTAYFVFTDFGIDKDLVRHSFQFKALRNIIGDCSNSEYCIQRT